MLSEHINEAVKGSCPYGKQTCLVAEGCWIITAWIRDHRAHGMPTELTPSPANTERLQESGRKGGLATAAKRRGDE
jgi:hypothetical protein